MKPKKEEDKDTVPEKPNAPKEYLLKLTEPEAQALINCLRIALRAADYEARAAVVFIDKLLAQEKCQSST